MFLRDFPLGSALEDFPFGSSTRSRSGRLCMMGGHPPPNLCFCGWSGHLPFLFECEVGPSTHKLKHFQGDVAIYHPPNLLLKQQWKLATRHPPKEEDHLVRNLVRDGHPPLMNLVRRWPLNMHNLPLLFLMENPEGYFRRGNR